MADRSIYLKRAREIWSQVRAFCLLWLAFTSLGGFIVLVGGPWVLGILTAIFGQAAARPGRVITILMIATLPIVIYFFLKQKRLAESTVVCSQCGERYANAHSSCPMCGCAKSSDNMPKDKKSITSA